MNVLTESGKNQIEWLTELLDCELQEKLAQAEVCFQREQEAAVQKNKIGSMTQKKAALGQKRRRIELLAEMFRYGGETIGNPAELEIRQLNGQIADCEAEYKRRWPGEAELAAARNCKDDAAYLKQLETKACEARSEENRKFLSHRCRTDYVAAHAKYWLLRSLTPMGEEEIFDAVHAMERYLSESGFAERLTRQDHACIKAMEAFLYQRAAGKICFAGGWERAEELFRQADAVSAGLTPDQIPYSPLALYRELSGSGYGDREEFLYLGYAAEEAGVTDAGRFADVWKRCFARAMQEDGYHQRMREVLRAGIREYLHCCEALTAAPVQMTWLSTPQFADYRKIFASGIRAYTESEAFVAEMKTMLGKASIRQLVGSGTEVLCMETAGKPAERNLTNEDLVIRLCGVRIQKDWEKNGIVWAGQHTSETWLRGTIRLLWQEQLAQYAGSSGMQEMAKVTAGSALQRARYTISDQKAVRLLQRYFSELPDELTWEDAELDHAVYGLFLACAEKQFACTEGKLLLDNLSYWKPFYGKKAFEPYEKLLEQGVRWREERQKQLAQEARQKKREEEQAAKQQEKEDARKRQEAERQQKAKVHRQEKLIRRQERALRKQQKKEEGELAKKNRESVSFWMVWLTIGMGCSERHFYLFLLIMLAAVLFRLGRYRTFHDHPLVYTMTLTGSTALITHMYFTLGRSEYSMLGKLYQEALILAESQAGSQPFLPWVYTLLAIVLKYVLPWVVLLLFSGRKEKEDRQ